MDANQDAVANPFRMDEDCRRCDRLCETRTRVVHGYGDVSAEFVFVAETPSAEADETGQPFASDGGERLLDVLARLGFADAASADARPELDNAYLTHLTRCRHPDRGPTDEEVRNCEGFLDAELRRINPEILVPVGQRPLEALLSAYTTERPAAYSVETDHATTIRGRGFEVVPMQDPAAATDDATGTFVEHLASLLERDYRQTKGRRRR